MFPMMHRAVMSDELQSSEPSILLFLHFSLPRSSASSLSSSCVLARNTWVNSVLDLFMNRFTSWSSTPAVGNRSSRGCFSSSIKFTSSVYSISNGIPSGEIGGFGLVELSRTDDSAAARGHVKSTGERPSPCGKPIVVSNSAECAVFNRVSASSSLSNHPDLSTYPSIYIYI